MNRRKLLGVLLALPVVVAAGPGEYVTPEGDEPLELWHPHTNKWWNCSFDQLIPGDMFRRKREPQHVYQMTKRTGEGLVAVTQWS